jgi:hypothetical protein
MTTLHTLKIMSMVILQIEHNVPNFDGWKRAFESDPIDRKKAGVNRYTILRPIDDPNYVIINLEFDHLAKAEETLEALHKLWENVNGVIMLNPQTRILELVENILV